jgi:hypothetical protein
MGQSIGLVFQQAMEVVETGRPLRCPVKYADILLQEGQNGRMPVAKYGQSLFVCG